MTHGQYGWLCSGRLERWMEWRAECFQAARDWMTYGREKEEGMKLLEGRVAREGRQGGLEWERITTSRPWPQWGHGYPARGGSTSSRVDYFVVSGLSEAARMCALRVRTGGD